MNKNKFKFTIVVAMYNSSQNTSDVVKKLLLPSLSLHGQKDIELIIIDDASPDKKFLKEIRRKYLPKFKTEFGQVTFIQNKINQGYTYCANSAIQVAKGKCIVFVNSDVYLPRGVLDSMYQILNSSKTIGAVGPVSNNVWSEQNLNNFPPLRNYTSSEVLRINKFAEMIKKKDLPPKKTKLLQGHCVFFKSSLFQKYGKFSRDLGEMFYEDVEYMMRVGAFVDLIIDTRSFVQHGGVGNKTSMSSRQDWSKTIQRFCFAFAAYFRMGRGFELLRISTWQIFMHYNSQANSMASYRKT